MAITEKKVSETLRAIGIPVNNYGFTYIKAAMLLLAQDEDYLHNLCKGLYVEISKQYKTMPSRVERAIRHSIESIYMRGDIEKAAFLGTPDPNTGKLKNGEFLGMLYEHLKFSEE